MSVPNNSDILDFLSKLNEKINEFPTEKIDAIYISLLNEYENLINENSSNNKNLIQFFKMENIKNLIIDFSAKCIRYNTSKDLTIKNFINSSLLLDMILSSPSTSSEALLIKKSLRIHRIKKYPKIKLLNITYYIEQEYKKLSSSLKLITDKFKVNEINKFALTKNAINEANKKCDYLLSILNTCAIQLSNLEPADLNEINTILEKAFSTVNVQISDKSFVQTLQSIIIDLPYVEQLDFSIPFETTSYVMNFEDIMEFEKLEKPLGRESIFGYHQILESLNTNSPRSISEDSIVSSLSDLLTKLPTLSTLNQTGDDLYESYEMQKAFIRNIQSLCLHYKSVLKDKTDLKNLDSIESKASEKIHDIKKEYKLLAKQLPLQAEPDDSDESGPSARKHKSGKNKDIKVRYDNTSEKGLFKNKHKVTAESFKNNIISQKINSLSSVISHFSRTEDKDADLGNSSQNTIERTRSL